MRSDLYKNIVKLLIGGGGGHIVQFLSIPLLAITYTQESLGLYFTGVAFASVILVVGSAQLQHAIPTLKENYEVGDAIAFVMLVCGVLFFLSFILGLVASESYFGFIVFTAAMAISGALNQVARSVLIRNGEVKKVASFLFLRGMLISISQIIFSVLNQNYGLFLGYLLGELACLLIMVFEGKRYRALIFSPGWLPRVWRKQKPYFITGTIQELISTLVFHLPILFIPYLFTLQQAGQFGLVHRLIWPPYVLVTSSIVNAIYVKYGQLTPEVFAKDVKVVIRKYPLAIIVIFVISFTTFSGFKIFTSPEWNHAPAFSFLLSIWAGAFLLSSPFRAACRMYRKQFMQLKVDSIILVILIGVSSIFLTTRGGSLTAIDYVFVLTAIGVLQNIMLSTQVYLQGMKVEKE